ncbi:serine kinase, partial [Mesorhizobium sp. M7A.F.Ca.CA.002.06.1.1]
MMPRNEPLALCNDDAFSHGRAKRERRFYRAYGLTIASEVTLPELQPATPGAADVVIAVGAIDLPKPSPEAATDFRFEPDRQYL